MFGMGLGGPHEDPSEIMRRIRRSEAENEDLPNLPSPPGSDVSGATTSRSGAAAGAGQHSYVDDDSSYQASMVVRRPSKVVRSAAEKEHLQARRRRRDRVNTSETSFDVVPDQSLDASTNDIAAQQQHRRVGTLNKDDSSNRRILSPLRHNRNANIGDAASPAPAASKGRVNSNNGKSAADGEPWDLAAQDQQPKPPQGSALASRPSPSTASSARTAILIADRDKARAAKSTVQGAAHREPSQPGVTTTRSKTAGSPRSPSTSLDDSLLAPPQSRWRGEQDDTSNDSALQLDSADLERLDVGDDSVPIHEMALGNGPDKEENSLGDSINEEEDAPTPVPRSSARFAASDSQLPAITEEGELDESSSAPDVLSPSRRANEAQQASSSGTTSDDGESGISPAEERIAHVVIRRKTNPLVHRSAALRDARGLSASPSSGSSPVTQSAWSTPGIGRRVPVPSRARRASEDISRGGGAGSPSIPSETPSKAYATTGSDSERQPPHSALPSRAYPDDFATPRASSTDADLERRKNHLLSTLRLTAIRSTAKPRYKQGTPFPNRNRRARSETPAPLGQSSHEGGNISERMGDREVTDDGSEDMTAASTASTSSHDLTTLPRGSGNTSLPLAGQGVADANVNRFNGAKLNSYLHTLNTHLTRENQNLVQTLAEAQNEVQRLKRKNAELSHVDEGNTNGASHSRDTEDTTDLTREMLDKHQRTSHDIREIREQLVGRKKSIATPGGSDSTAHHKVRALEKSLARRDEEITSLRRQLMDVRANEAEPSSSADQSSTTAPGLQQQIFDLADQLEAAKGEIDVQAEEMSRLRQQVLDSSTGHTKATAQMQSHVDDLLQQIEERDQELDRMQQDLEDQEANFAKKMNNLEEELCKVMEEQEQQLRSARKELEAMKGHSTLSPPSTSADTINAVDDLRSELESARKEISTLQGKLIEATAGSPLPSDQTSNEIEGTPQCEQMQAEIKSLQTQLQNMQRHSEHLQEQLTTLEDQRTDQARTLSERIETLQKELEAAHEDLVAGVQISRDQAHDLEIAQANTRNLENQVRRLKIQLEEAQSQISRLQQEQVNTSIAMDNTLQQKLDAAQREIGHLKHQLASPSTFSKAIDAKEVEIRTLKSNNHELETRVNQLKRQALAGGVATPPRGTPDKSVRFDSVKSMRTPRTASQLIGNMTSFDRTATEGNVTAAPLYVEIDNLQDQVNQLRGLLNQANEDVDDKLRKLDRSGKTTISLSEQLERAHGEIKRLQNALKTSGNSDGGDNAAIVRELRTVQDRMLQERSALLRELGEIKSYCQYLAAQLPGGKDSALPIATDPDDRLILLRGVAVLKDDIRRVQADAATLAEDIKQARLLETAGQDSAGSACSKPECRTASLLHRQQAYGLLAHIKYLKAAILRDSWFRADLAQQKSYLMQEIARKQSTLDATSVTLARFGMSIPPTIASASAYSKRRGAHPSLRAVANVVLFTQRLRLLRTEWQKQAVVRMAVKEAYKQVRGKPLMGPQEKPGKCAQTYLIEAIYLSELLYHLSNTIRWKEAMLSDLERSQRVGK